MFDFEYCIPTRVSFGRGVVDKTGEYVRKFRGAKVLVLSYGRKNPALAKILDRVEASISAAGAEYIEFGGIVPNPRLSRVYEGIELCRNEGIDFLLAVGGGSVIDSAKAIGYGLANSGDVWDFFKHTRTAENCMPVGVVLTIAASGSEMSNSCVITNEATGEKRSYNNDAARPVFAVMDPELTTTLSAAKTANGCADILMHTEERYFTGGGNMELTDSVSEALMRTVIRFSRVLIKDLNNYEARAEIMWAGSLSHNGLMGCGTDGGDWAVHKLEHELSGMFDVTHGPGLTSIWPTWARYVYKNCLPRFKKFAVNVMGVEDKGTDEEIALAGIKAKEEYYRSIGMPVNISELGISPTVPQMREMARNCSAAVGGHIGSAMILYEEDMFNIYKGAL